MDEIADSIRGLNRNLVSMLKPITGVTLVANLPASPSIGQLASVTDGDSGLAWGDTVVNTGSGTTKYLVWWNGANWTVAGK